PYKDGPNCLKYIPLQINDDDSTESMLELVDTPDRAYIHLYVEIEDISPADPYTLYGRLLTDDASLDELQQQSNYM
ncbi:hypothetical protein, partial [Bartonella sp. AC134YNZD]|uniref:hypothetical protein n=1 Tax=Bartonella sp. AC134YNZD TaxID=3243446 RepID=UPI0035CF4842